MENTVTAKPDAWPDVTSENMPWTRWWWLGSAVDKEAITRLMEEYRDAGLGGVEITAIYGVQGQEGRNIEYLSPEWLEMARHAIAEARRLGMQVDMPPGSGWRIGGSFVTDEVGAAKLHIEKRDADGGYALESRPSGEPVKRAGPGGEGRAFNPFSRASLQAAIDHFTPAFSELGIRAQFHDSWEYGSNACPEMFDRFRELRGYDLREHAAALAGEGDADLCARVKYDLQRTLAEMALDDFIVPWAEWCRELGQLSRNQAHGSPGNLLDLYAAADIPETEVFRSVRPDTPLMSKFASSAGHVAGRRIVSSETATWLKEHFQVALADVKLLLDNLFVSGINHHVYHGTAYSPADAEWPGWLFYASTQFNPQNTIWRDFPTLNEYATRCQSVLQAGEPDADLLVYFPVHDELHRPERRIAEQLVIEGSWLEQTEAVGTYRKLWRRGFEFDYVSDRQLAGATVDDGRVVMPGGRWRAVVVPPCRFVPVATLKTLARLQAQGVPVLFDGHLPEDVPGLPDLEGRRTRMRELLAGLRACADLEDALSDAGVEREEVVDLDDVLFIRRRVPGGRDYFIANQGGSDVDAFVKLACDWQSVLVMDPMSGRTGLAQTADGKVRLQLDAGASVVLRALEDPLDAEPWRYVDGCGPAVDLDGEWRVEFIDGGQVLPDSYETRSLRSWTERGADAERFAGTAVYRIAFDAPSGAAAWLLDLGGVHASARVRLNGAHVATLIGPTFRTVLHDLRPTGNELEVEVTSLAANRIRDLDRRGVEWRIFADINFVAREYKPFDASGWPVTPSGLLGPVRLEPLLA